MSVALTTTFWISLGLLAYTYAGYPALILFLSRVRPRAVRKQEASRSVSVVMSVRNEQERLGAKLENLLALDYPADRLEVIVVNDGSTDGTGAVAASYSPRRVKSVELPEDRGKASALNEGVAASTGEVLLFCDVRQRIDSRALKELTAWFSDDQVGAVSGELHLEGDIGPGAYWKYEKAIRAAESRVDSVVGATGALYAARRSLYRPIPAGCLLDDVFTPMQVVMAGYRVGFEPNAKAFDQEASVEGEFARKARTLAGNFQLIQLMPSLLNPFRNRVFFQLVSHKLLRLLCPFALIGLLATNVALVITNPTPPILFVAVLGGQILAYGLAGWATLRKGRVGRISRLCQTFVVLNVAAIEGLRRFLMGELQWTSGR